MNHKDDQLFDPAVFFDLSHFSHASIFDRCEHVWDALKKLSTYLNHCEKGKIKGEVSQQAYVINPSTIFIDEGTIVEPGAYIRGPCYIGKNCTIRHGAYIRGDVLMGDNVVIGHDTETKNSIFLNGAHAAHFAYVGDSILGANSNLGAGTICANFRFDGQKIHIKYENRKIATGLKKFGAILGDRAQTGCNSVLSPGTLFGKDTLCYPCLNVSGYVPANSLIKPSAHPQIIQKR